VVRSVEAARCRVPMRTVTAGVAPRLGFESPALRRMPGAAVARLLAGIYSSETVLIGARGRSPAAITARYGGASRFYGANNRLLVVVPSGSLIRRRGQDPCSRASARPFPPACEAGVRSIWTQDSLETRGARMRTTLTPSRIAVTAMCLIAVVLPAAASAQS